MSGWTSTRLGELVSITRGTTYKSLLLDQPGPVLLGLASIHRNGGFRTDRLRTYGGDSPEKLLVRPGQLLASLKDVTQSGDLLGSVARVPEGGPLGRLSQDTVRLDFISDKVDPGFVYLALLSPGYRAWCRRHATGTTTLGLPRDDFLAFEILHPVGRDEQRNVASVLDSIDDLIENDRRRVEVLEEMARAIYREWFVKFRYPGHGAVPLVDSALGPIPGGWTVHPFAEIASFVNGFAFKPSHWGSEGRPIIKIKELKQGVVAGTPRHPAESIAEKYWVERGDLLFSWSADLGVYLWNDEPGLLNQHLFTVRPVRPSLTIPFLFHALDQAMSQFRSRAQGTTMRHIKRSALSEVQTSIPGEELLERFSQTVEPMHEESARLRREATLLEALRDLLLPKLVTGQVDVSTLDLDALVSTGSTDEGAVA